MVGMRRLADPCHGYATPRSPACQHVPRSQIRVTVMAVAGWPGQDNACGAQWLRHAFLGEWPQTLLETGGKVGVDGRLSFGAAAGRLGAWHFGFADAERVIQEQAGVGIAGVFCDERYRGIRANIEKTCPQMILLRHPPYPT